MTEPETEIKPKPKYEYNSAYCRARYRANKYKIRAKYFERKHLLASIFLNVLSSPGNELQVPYYICHLYKVQKLTLHKLQY